MQPPTIVLASTERGTRLAAMPEGGRFRYARRGPLDERSRRAVGIGGSTERRASTAPAASTPPASPSSSSEVAVRPSSASRPCGGRSSNTRSAIERDSDTRSACAWCAHLLLAAGVYAIAHAGCRGRAAAQRGHAAVRRPTNPEPRPQERSSPGIRAGTRRSRRYCGSARAGDDGPHSPTSAGVLPNPSGARHRKSTPLLLLGEPYSRTLDQEVVNVSSIRVRVAFAARKSASPICAPSDSAHVRCRRRISWSAESPAGVIRTSLDRRWLGFGS
jgi:hypothetical protein